MMLASLGFLGCFFLNEFTTFGFTRLATFFWLLYSRLVILRLMVLDFYDFTIVDLVFVPSLVILASLAG